MSSVLDRIYWWKWVCLLSHPHELPTLLVVQSSCFKSTYYLNSIDC